MKNQKQTHLRLKEETLKNARMAAASKNISLSSYIECLLSETARSESRKEEDAEAWLRVDQKTADILKEKARHAGVSMDVYLQKLANPTPPVVLQVKLDDLNEMTETMNELVETVNATARILLRNNTASPETVDRMIRALYGIHDKYKKVYLTVLHDREQLYHDVMKELTVTVKARKNAPVKNTDALPAADRSEHHAGSAG